MRAAKFSEAEKRNIHPNLFLFGSYEEVREEEERHTRRRGFYTSLAMSQEVVMCFLMLLFMSSRGRTAYDEITTVLW